MSANISDKLTAVRSGSSNAPVTTVASTRSIGGTSLACTNLTGWPTGTAIHFQTYKKKADGSKDFSSACDWKGIVSGNTIGSLTLENGTDAGNGTDSYVEMTPTAAWGQDLYDGLTKEHNADGTHNTAAATTIAASLPAGSITPAMRTGGFKIGTIPGSTFSTTGNKSITGVGFKPKLVRFTLMPTSSSTVMNMAHGAMTSTNQFYSAFLTNARMSGTDAAFGWLGSTTSLSLKFAYVSMDSDGFTINVSSAASAFDVSYEAYA